MRRNDQKISDSANVNKNLVKRDTLGYYELQIKLNAIIQLNIFLLFEKFGFLICIKVMVYFDSFHMYYMVAVYNESPHLCETNSSL